MSRVIIVKNIESGAEFILKDEKHMRRFLILTYGKCPETYTDLIDSKVPYKDKYLFRHL